jgi:hypothetical protein
MVRRHFLSFLTVCLVAGIALVACKESQLTLDDIIERNTNAVGGRSAIEAVKSIEVDLHIADPGFEVDGKYRAARPGRMRIDIMAGGNHVYTEAFNGTRGWQWKGKGDPVDESPAATATLRHGVELPGKLFGLHELQSRGHRIDFKGREKIDGVDHYSLHVVLADGYETALYVDPRSWFVTRRRDVRPLHVDVDPTPTTIESHISDFRAVSGVFFGFSGVDTDLNTGKVLERTEIRAIKVNPEIDPSIFDKL